MSFKQYASPALNPINSMSTIIAVETNQGLAIGADSCVHTGALVRTMDNMRENRKILKFNNDCFIAIVGPVKAIQSIQSIVSSGELAKSELKSELDLFCIIENLTKILESEYRLVPDNIDDEAFQSIHFEVLAMTSKSIFGSDLYGATVEYKRFWAKGSGAELALGALQSSYHVDECPKKLVLRALEVAASFDDSTREPFLIESFRRR